ncbi:MAG: dehydrogenase [Deltaproteobacteria bacterium HGW-Deltaproteobacteria-9]|nr:MAG: dehydrogenase [Deltaproteobacteria bacterium HGW-Deltaproteobacteria-9]
MHQTDSLRHPLQLYRYIRECLAHKESIALATVIARSGSGPREAGASIILTATGRTLGTVGGGLLEASTLEMAAAAIRNHRPACRTFSLTDNEVSAGGMICGGHVEILVDYLDADNPLYRDIFEVLLQHEKTGNSCWLIRSIRTDEKTGMLETGMGLMDEAGYQSGSFSSTGVDINNLLTQCRKKEPTLIALENTRYFVQQIDVPETVFICGAGHIGQELAAICTFAGFRTVVIDDRREFANEQRFPAADEIIVVNSFAECFSSLPVNIQTYVVIATRGHAFDQCVLSDALQTSAGYIGMIASRRKREIIFQNLRAAGVEGEELAAVHSPIGMDIGAQTPAEIAVSIAAELIAVRNGHIEKRSATRG